MNTVTELVNARFLDAGRGKYYGDSFRLFIENGRLVTLHNFDDKKPGRRIDLQGKCVLPALFNTHCHITMTDPTIVPRFSDIKASKRFSQKQIEKNMAECLARGITNIRDAGAGDLSRLNAVMEDIGNGRYPGPRIMKSVIVGQTGGYNTEEYRFIEKKARAFMGQSVLDRALPSSGVLVFPPDAGTQTVRDAVNKAIDERGARTIKVCEELRNYTNPNKNNTVMSQRQLDALADQARKRGVKSTIHQVTAETFRRALSAGFDSLAHVAQDEPLSDSEVKTFVQNGCILEPTLSVAYDLGYRMKDCAVQEASFLEKLTSYRDRHHEELMREFWVKELLSRTLEHHRKISAGKTRMLGVVSLDGMFRYYCRKAPVFVSNFRKLYEGAARIAASNDGGVPPCTPAMIGLEMTLMELMLSGTGNENCFSGAEAVKTATVTSAESLGLEDTYGSIEDGKIADLAVLDGDPLTDPQLIGSPVDALFMDGQLVINKIGLKMQ